MASDGCQPMPRAQYPIYGVRHWYDYEGASHNDGHVKQQHVSEREQTRMATSYAELRNIKGNTGTWNGPAPVGSLSPVPVVVDRQTVRETPSSTPPFAVLPGGLRLPLMGLSTNTMTGELLTKSLEKGYRHIECDPAFGNESALGLALGASPIPREELFISSTLPQSLTPLDPENIRRACESTLSALKVQYLDVYYLPPMQHVGAGAESELSAVWTGLEALVDAGLVRHLGLAHLSLPQIEQIRGNCRITPACLKVELHPLLAQRKLVGVCKRYGLALIAASPIPDVAADKVINQVAQECGHSCDQVTLRWNLQRQVAVLVPGTQEAKVLDCFDALTFCLLDAEKRQLDALDQNQRFATVPFSTVTSPEEGGATKPSVVLDYGK